MLSYMHTKLSHPSLDTNFWKTFRGWWQLCEIRESFHLQISGSTVLRECVTGTCVYSLSLSHSLPGRNSVTQCIASGWIHWGFVFVCVCRLAATGVCVGGGYSNE